VTTGYRTVHVRVNDATTGQPTPVCIRLSTPSGEYCPPLGRLAEFATGRNQDLGGNLLWGMKPYAYLDGSCEVRLPPGTILVEVQKGPEYLPLRREVSLGVGQLALRLAVERWTDWRQQGWYSGDTRVHFLPPHAALLEAAAEDVAVVNLLATECRVPGLYGKEYPAIPNLLAFSGQRPALESPCHLVAVNTLNIHSVLGCLGLLHCHRVVYPLRFGGPDGWEKWTMADWCDQCHRKRGLVVWPAARRGSAEFDFGEPLADLILGKVDALEIDSFEDSPFDVLPDWYKLLNAGFRVPLVGASGKDSNGIRLGAMRTYARLLPEEEFTYTHWIEAVRAGRTFVTNGPLLSLTVNGQDPGSVLDLGTAGESVGIRAEARSAIPFERLEVIDRGTVVASAAASGSPAAAVVEAELPVAASTWLAARCQGQQQVFHRPANQRVFAHTSAVTVRVAGRPLRPDPAAVTALLEQLDRMLNWAKARHENEPPREAFAELFQTARDKLSRPE
jgi:hypothetical protein